MNIIYGDIDASPTKDWVLEHREAAASEFFHRAFVPRPAEELYDLARDPHELENVAADSDYASELERLRGALSGWMQATHDPRSVDPRDPRWDKYPYFGPPEKRAEALKGS